MLKRFFLVALMVLVASPAMAGECPKMKAHKEKMARFLKDDLGLDEDEAGKVGAVLGEFHAMRHAAEKEKHEAFEALETLVEAKETSIEVYQKAMDRCHKAMEAYLAAKKGKSDALSGLLDARQLAILNVHIGHAHGHHDKDHKDCGCNGDGSCEKVDSGCKHK